MAASLISLRSTAAIVFGSVQNVSRFMPPVNVSIMPMGSTMSRSELSAFLKGKYGLARGPFADLIFHCPCGCQVHGNAENIGEPILQAYHIE